MDPLDDPRAPRSLRRQSPRPQPNAPAPVPPPPWDRASHEQPPTPSGRDPRYYAGPPAASGRAVGPRTYSTEGFLPRLTREEPSLSPAYSRPRGPSQPLYPPGRAPMSQPREPEAYAGAPSQGAGPYGGFRIPGAAPETEEQKARRRGSRGRVARAVLLVALVPLVVAVAVLFGPRVVTRLRQNQPPAAQATLTVTVGPTPTVLPRYSLFASEQSPYTINYPDKWKTQSSIKTISGIAHYIDIFSPTDATASVAVEQTTTPLPVSDLDIINAEVAGAQTAEMTFTEVTSKATTQTLSGEKWQRREYDVTNKGAKLHMAVLATHHSDKVYVIVLLTSADSYEKTDKATFTPMLNSFRFTK